MSSEDRDDLTLAVFLLALAGFVDAVGFLILGNLFVSFMSGTSTQFAIGAGQGASAAAAAAGAIIGLFVYGVMVGRVIAIGAGIWRRPTILALEAALLAAAAGTPVPALAAGGLMAVAMGAQNGLLHKAGRTTTGLTYVTGSLVKFGEAFADALAGAGPASAAWPYLALWLGLVAGGAAGAVAYGEFGRLALALPALAAALLGAAVAGRSRRAA